MRKLVWTVETDLEAGQLLYLTGDPAALGCWEPEMAILMSPTEHANLWKAEVKVNCKAVECDLTCMFVFKVSDFPLPFMTIVFSYID